MRALLPLRGFGLQALATALLAGAGAGCSIDACDTHKRKIESCHRVFEGDACATPLDRCLTACWALASCAEWDAIDDNRPPADVARCTLKCSSPARCTDGMSIESHWQCDGAEDCADGSDEGAQCDYHLCANGQAVREFAECDGYAECADGSDEESCS